MLSLLDSKRKNSAGALVILDVETTGLSPEHDRIIELAAIRVIGSRDRDEVFIEEKMDVYVQLPDGEKLPERIVSLTGISDELLETKGISEEEAAAQFRSLITSDTVLIAHNAQFDASFISKYLGSDQGCCSWLDTLSVYKDRSLFPHKLSDAITKYGLDDKVQNTHRAIDDVLALWEVVKAMDNERSDLNSYINVFGFNPKYGLKYPEMEGVTYMEQPYRHDCDMVGEFETLAIKACLNEHFQLRDGLIGNDFVDSEDLKNPLVIYNHGDLYIMYGKLENGYFEETLDEVKHFYKGMDGTKYSAHYVARPKGFDYDDEDNPYFNPDDPKCNFYHPDLSKLNEDQIAPFGTEDYSYIQAIYDVDWEHPRYVFGSRTVFDAADDEGVAKILSFAGDGGLPDNLAQELAEAKYIGAYACSAKEELPKEEYEKFCNALKCDPDDHILEVYKDGSVGFSGGSPKEMWRKILIHGLRPNYWDYEYVCDHLPYADIFLELSPENQDEYDDKEEEYEDE